MDATVNGNGTLTTRDTPPQGEQGTAWSGELLFERYDSGAVFTQPYEARPDQIEEMLRHDGKARALEATLTLPLRGAGYTITPPDDDRGQTDFVTDALEKPANAGGMSTPFTNVIAQMTSARMFRASFHEKVFGLDPDGRVVFDKLAFRHARTCWLRRDVNTQAFEGFRQYARKGYEWEQIDIPAAKSFVYLHGQSRDPLNGVSDLETAYSCWTSKQKVRFLWYQFLEQQSTPKALAKLDTNDPKGAADFAKKASTLKGGGVLGLTADQSLNVFEGNGAGAAHFQEALRYLDSEMSGSVLAGFTDLTAQSGSGRGSYALSKDQSDFFLMSCEAILGEMAAAINSWLIADLVHWNFGQDAAVPLLEFEALSEEDITPAVTLLQALATNTNPQPPVPKEFIDLLTEEVASFLGLDVDKVHQAIQNAQTQAGSPVGQFQAGIDAAHRLAVAAGVGVGAGAGAGAGQPGAG